MTELPSKVKSYADVPRGADALYEEDPNDATGYCLTPGGVALMRAQQALKRSPSGSWNVTPHLSTTRLTVTRADWSNATAIAKPNERRCMIKAAAAGLIRIK